MKYGLIGEHLTHSYSCEIHAAIADYAYELTELRPEELGDFLRRRDFCGINVTIPYKQAVIPYLDGVSGKAARIGAVNTIVNRDGKLFGYNTDYAGMRAQAERIGIRAAGKKVLILGTGGTSKTALVLAEDLGAGEILRVSRKKQSPNDAESKAECGRQNDPQIELLRGNDGIIGYEEACTLHRDAAIIINTTPAGMYPHPDGQAVTLEPFSEAEAVLDVVYNPLRTDLVLEAQSRGIPTEGGLYMLSAQGAAASALFRNIELPEGDTEKAFLNVRDKKRNIVLIGMPTSGKTSVGRLLADRTGLHFRDTDEEIVKKTGLPIPAYFEKYGEAAFRKEESAVIRALAAEGGRVIATGGGAVLNPENVRILKRNGILVFLDRSPEKLTAAPDRPLSMDREALLKRYRERYGLYCAAADLRIPGDGTVEETAASIEQEMKKQ